MSQSNQICPENVAKSKTKQNNYSPSRNTDRYGVLVKAQIVTNSYKHGGHRKCGNTQRYAHCHKISAHTNFMQYFCTLVVLTGKANWKMASSVFLAFFCVTESNFTKRKGGLHNT